MINEEIKDAIAKFFEAAENMAFAQIAYDSSTNKCMEARKYLEKTIENAIPKKGYKAKRDIEPGEFVTSDDIEMMLGPHVGD